MVVPWICPKCGREVGVMNAGTPAELCAACEEAQLAEAHVVLVRRYEPALTLLQEIGTLVLVDVIDHNGGGFAIDGDL